MLCSPRLLGIISLKRFGKMLSLYSIGLGRTLRKHTEQLTNSVLRKLFVDSFQRVYANVEQ